MHDFQLLNGTLIVSAMLFSIGAIGVIMRRNRVTLTISFGILIQSSAVAAVGFSSFHNEDRGRLLWSVVLSSLLVLAGIAAGIALLTEIVDRRRQSTNDASVKLTTSGPPSGGNDD